MNVRNIQKFLLAYFKSGMWDYTTLELGFGWNQTRRTSATAETEWISTQCTLPAKLLRLRSGQSRSASRRTPRRRWWQCPVLRSTCLTWDDRIG